jgi:hypothetical protein
MKWLTRISIVLGVIALAITVWTVGPEVLVTHLRAIGPWFAVLVAIELASTFCDAGVLYVLTRGRGAPTFRKVCVAQFAGRAVNSVTPGGNLGEVLKVSLLARECSTERILAAVLFSTIGTFVTGLAIVAAGSIATAFMFSLPRAAEIALVGVGVLAAAVVIATLVVVKRGMIAMLARAARRLHLLSQARYERWCDRLADVDRRIVEADHRGTAIVLVIVSQLLTRGVIWAALVAAGYSLGAPQLVAVLSAGVLLSWISGLVPMGVGVSEGGNGVLFALIGAAPSLGVAIAFARRVNQIVFAVIGFSVLGIDRLASAPSAPELVAQPVVR